MSENVRDRIYAQMEPYIIDGDPDGALLAFIGALGAQSETIDSYASDGPNGEPGWSILLDLNRAPSEVLPWLGQFVGVAVDESLSDADQRAQILGTSNQKRGSVSALKASIAPYLTGSKTVVFRERDAAASPLNPAYGLTVITYEAETPVAEWPTTNLLDNGDLETDAAGTVTGGNATAARVTSVAAHGNASLQVAQTAAGQFTYGFRKRAGTYVPVTVGLPYSGTVFARNAVGNCPVQAQITFLNSSDAAISSVAGPIITPALLSAGGFSAAIVENAIAPAGAVTAILYLVCRADIPGGTGFIVHMDDAQFEQHTRATPVVHTNTAIGSRTDGSINILKALLAQKPAGIILNYFVRSGQDYQSVYNNEATYATLYTDYLTYQGLLDARPGN